jgi:outer membrane protein assembly factor BamD (BamD/ComL family)
MENYKAAVASGELFLEAHGQSDFSEEINYVVVKNAYFLTINSIESKKSERIEQTNERFRTFVARHPQSKYSKELSSYLDKLSENNN